MNKTEIDELLARHFAEEYIDKEELQVLQKWISENPEEYLRVQVLMADLAPLSEDKYFSTEEAWDKIKAKRAPHARVKRIQMPNKRWLAAAATILVFFVGAYLFATATITRSTSKGEMASIELSDGSTMMLNENSSVSYQRYSFLSRRIKMKGEAYFNVIHNKARPFVVTSPSLKVTVLGTSFTVKDRADEKMLFVERGLVNVLHQPSGNNITLSTGQCGTFTAGSWSQSAGMTSYALAWKTKQLTFRDAPLSEALKAIGNTYGVQHIELDSVPASCRVTADFEKLTLDEVMQQLSRIVGFNYEIRQDTILIRELKCN